MKCALYADYISVQLSLTRLLFVKKTMIKISHKISSNAIWPI